MAAAAGAARPTRLQGGGARALVGRRVYSGGEYELVKPAPTCGGPTLQALVLDEAMFSASAMAAGGELSFEQMKLPALGLSLSLSHLVAIGHDVVPHDPCFPMRGTALLWQPHQWQPLCHGPWQPKWAAAISYARPLTKCYTRSVSPSSSVTGRSSRKLFRRCQYRLSYLVLLAARVPRLCVVQQWSCAPVSCRRARVCMEYGFAGFR